MISAVFGTTHVFHFLSRVLSFVSKFGWFIVSGEGHDLAGIGKFNIRVLRYHAVACYFADCNDDSISWGINRFGFSPVARLW